MTPEELRKFLDEATNTAALEAGLEADDIELAKQLAERVYNDDLTPQQAEQTLIDHCRAKGYDVPTENEGVMAEMIGDARALREIRDFESLSEDWIDIADRVRMALREAGEPGIADAIMEVKVNKGPIPTDPEERNQVAMGMKCKAWFNFDAMNEDEQKRFTNACILAARDAGVVWPFPNG